MQSGLEQPTVARWYQSKQAAISLRFDDSHPSHIRHVIPILNQKGILATFMVNPGTKAYQKNRDIWEKSVPQMGHRLGNHTMHHKGAKDLTEAEYEIGEVTRLIWRLYPDETQLNVFASGGGGVLWGGKLWEQADESFKQLVKGYNLIDLYDGFHRSKPYNSTDTAEDYCRMFEKTLNTGNHKAFHFHTVGKPDVKDKLRKMMKGVSLDVDLETFESILNCMKKYERQIWIAPLIDILKYEKQYKTASIKMVKEGDAQSELKLFIETDIGLYDHPLTIAIPANSKGNPKSVRQNDKPLTIYHADDKEYTLVDVQPISSTISIQY